LEAWQRYHCGSVELSRQSHAMSNGNVALERGWGVDDLERCGSVDDLEREGGVDDLERCRSVDDLERGVLMTKTLIERPFCAWQSSVRLARTPS